MRFGLWSWNRSWGRGGFNNWFGCGWFGVLQGLQLSRVLKAFLGLLGFLRALLGFFLLLPLQLLQLQITPDFRLGIAEAQLQALEAGAREHLHIKTRTKADQLSDVETDQALGHAIGHTKAKTGDQRTLPDGLWPRLGWLRHPGHAAFTRATTLSSTIRNASAPAPNTAWSMQKLHKPSLHVLKQPTTQGADDPAA